MIHSYNRFAKTPGFQTGDESEARFQDSADMEGEALESLKYKKTADSQSAEAYRKIIMVNITIILDSIIVRLTKLLFYRFLFRMRKYFFSYF